MINNVTEKNKIPIKLLEMVVVPLVVAILIIIFTPLGESIKLSLFPLPTAIEGFIKDSIEKKPIPSVQVVIQRSNFKDDTNEHGKFTIENIPNGKTYQFDVMDENSNPIYGTNEFFFPPNTNSYNLGDIFVDKPSQKNISNKSEASAFVPSQSQVEYQIDLMAKGTFIPIELRKPGLESNTYKIIAQVKANNQTLSQIERVTYYLDSSFNPNIISSYYSKDNYSIYFTAWGKFDIKAKVYFKGNTVKDLILPKEDWII
ncbi:MAG TPA: pYEATS domain-containing protein [Nitrososphaeraceae archaeon]|nr:pYEATS domain-containing protein [Nitrososphaeraceae archaeon]